MNTANDITKYRRIRHPRPRWDDTTRPEVPCSVQFPACPQLACVSYRANCTKFSAIPERQYRMDTLGGMMEGADRGTPDLNGCRGHFGRSDISRSQEATEKP